MGTKVSSHVFDARPSDQLYSGGSFNADTDSGVGTINPSNRINVTSPHVQHEGGDDASSVINPGDRIKPENSPVTSSKHEKSIHLHPLPLLVKQTQKETIEGLSFPTVQYFKQFVESMKNAYLTPGNDLSRYFQTARDVLDREFPSNAQDPATDYRPDSSNETADPDDLWSESMNSVENEQDVQFQKLSVPDSAPSNVGSNFAEVPNLDLSTRAQLAADGRVSEGDGGAARHLSAGLQTAAGAQNRATHPVSLRLTEHVPAGWFFGELPSAAVLIGPAHGAAPDLDPKASEGMIQKSDSEDSLKYENPSGGFQRDDFQKKDLREKIPADVLYLPKAAPQVGHINNGDVSGRASKAWESLSSSSQTHQPTAGEEESEGLSRSFVHLPVFGSSASSNANLSPRGRQGQAGEPLSSPHVLEYEAFSRRQPPRPQHGEPNTIFGINERKQVGEDVQAFSSGDSDSQPPWISSPYKGDYGLHWLTKLPQPSASDSIFWRKIGHKENSRNSKMKNIISDGPNMPRSFFGPQKIDVALKDGFAGPAEAAIPHSSVQDTFYWPPHSMYAFKSPKSGASQRRNGARKGLFYQTGDSFLSLPFYTTKTRSDYFRSKVSFSKTHYAPP